MKQITIFFILTTVLLSCYAYAEMNCDEVVYGKPNYMENMGKLATEAKLPDSYYSKYHQEVVKLLCSGDLNKINQLIDYGHVKAKEVEAIAAVLGKQYKASPRSEAGKLYEKTYLKLLEFGVPKLCASNAADEYVKNTDGSVGKLVQTALTGDKDAVKVLKELSNAKRSENNKSLVKEEPMKSEPEQSEQENSDKINNSTPWLIIKQGEVKGEYKFEKDGTLFHKTQIIIGFKFDGEQIAVSPPSPDKKHAICVTYNDQDSKAFLLKLSNNTGEGLSLEGPPMLLIEWSPEGKYAVLASYYESDMKLYLISLSPVKTFKIPTKLDITADEELIYELDKLEWTDHRIISFPITIHCNLYDGENCSEKQHETVLRTYMAQFDVINMKSIIMHLDGTPYESKIDKAVNNSPAITNAQEDKIDPRIFNPNIRAIYKDGKITYVNPDGTPYVEPKSEQSTDSTTATNKNTSDSKNQIKIKGIYMGMDFNEAKKICQTFISEGMVMTDAKIQVDIVDFATGQVSRLIPDSDNKLVSVLFTRRLIDNMFNSSGIPIETFVKQFIAAYKIPQMEPFYSDGYAGWNFTSPYGYVVEIIDYKRGVLQIQKIAASNALKFD
jgi:hypothetical protein